MVKSSETLEAFIKNNKIDAEIIRSKLDVSSSLSPELSAIVDPASIIKSICLILDNKTAVVAILYLMDKIDFEKIKTELNVKEVRLAHDNEIIQTTKYAKGGVPPIGYKLYFLLDSKVLEKDTVYGGGGDKNALIKIKVKDIISLDKPRIFNFTV